VGIWDWKDQELLRATRNVLKSNLCLNKEDKLVILTDSYKERVGELLFWQATSLGLSPIHYTYRPTGRHGLEPPEEVWKIVFGEEFVEELKEKGLLEKLLKKELSHSDELEVKALLLESTSEGELPTAIIAVNQYSVSHTFFRKLCSEFLSIRFASMPLFEPFMFYTSLQANWNLVARRSREIADLLSDAVSARITCPLGTELFMSLEGRSGLADSGKLCSPGDFGNLPQERPSSPRLKEAVRGLSLLSMHQTGSLKRDLSLRLKRGKLKSSLEGRTLELLWQSSLLERRVQTTLQSWELEPTRRRRLKRTSLKLKRFWGPVTLRLVTIAHLEETLRLTFT
jgi:hypothetical protein